MKLTEWTTCGGMCRQMGRGTAQRPDRRPGRTQPIRTCCSGWRPSTTPPCTGSAPDTALVSTTDFFPPLVDDPADFGAIAAANACSDVFAMGGRVVLALNIAAFPEDFPPEAIAEIFAAAAQVVAARRGHGGRRPHHPLGRADLRAGGPGDRPPRPGVDQGGAPDPATGWCFPSRSGPASSWRADRPTRRPPP